MPFDFGDVVLVPFPFTNQTISKQSPAVIVSAGRHNDHNGGILRCLLSIIAICLRANAST